MFLQKNRLLEDTPPLKFFQCVFELSYNHNVTQLQPVDTGGEYAKGLICSILTSATQLTEESQKCQSQSVHAQIEVQSGRISENTCVGGPCVCRSFNTHSCRDKLKHFHTYCRITNAWGHNSTNTHALLQRALMCRWQGVVPRQSSWINWTLELYSGMWQTVSQTTSQSNCIGKISVLTSLLLSPKILF